MLRLVTAGRKMSVRMKASRQCSDDILAVLREGKGLRIRAGTSQHRLIGIWAVVVKDRAFIQSWSVKPNGWYRTFLKKPRGSIQMADHEIAVRAVYLRKERLRDAIDHAHLEKYNTAGALKYRTVFRIERLPGRLQMCVLHFRLLQDRNVGISILPECEEILISTLRL
jgi:hypothetical protein